MSRIPVFSSFLRLKHTNPSVFHNADTIKQMVKAQRQLGDRFYDALPPLEAS